MERQTWHFIFHKTAYTAEQINQLLRFLKQHRNFGGFPIVDLQVDGNSRELIFMTLTFDPLTQIEPALQAEMAKFVLLQTIRPAQQSQQADMKLYGELMSQSIQALGIEFLRYDQQTMDVVYWGTEQR